ncbi:transglycosylase SLT domain-containing protein [Chitinibacteraceae bacterium HSL-7]
MKFLASLAALLPLVAAASNIDLDQLEDAAKRRDVATLSQIASEHQSDLLAMYPQYYLIKAQLPGIESGVVTSFLARYPNTPLADTLRGDWLPVLGKTQDWAAFDREYAQTQKRSDDVECYAAQSALAQGREPDLAEIRSLWNAGKPQPQSCGPVFDRLRARNTLTIEDHWLRIRAALAGNRTDFARQLGNQLGSYPALQSKALAVAAKQPVKSLLANPMASRADEEVAIYAISRLTRSNADAAAAWLENRAASWSAATKKAAWHEVAVVAAKARHRDASRWFEMAGPQGDAEDRAWAIRAALRAQDLKTAMARIDALPGDEASDPAWRYWKAQALRRDGRNAEAEQMLASIADDATYYGILAASALDRPLLAAPYDPIKPTSDELNAVRQRPGIARALALYDGDWRLTATREWIWAIRDMSDRELVAAALVAERAGVPDRAINTADKAGHRADITLRYPLLYRNAIEREAAANGVDPAWVYGLIRQESRFMVDARSSVGAGGLMQIMPATARWIAKKMDKSDFNTGDVRIPATNIEMGTFYLAHIRDTLFGHPVLATAGYNAGPGRARQWQADTPLDALIYVETIPFNETRDYVKKVLSNAHVYRYAFKNAPPLINRLTPVPARNGGNGADSAID